MVYIFSGQRIFTTTTAVKLLLFCLLLSTTVLTLKLLLSTYQYLKLTFFLLNKTVKTSPKFVPLNSSIDCNQKPYLTLLLPNTKIVNWVPYTTIPGH